MVRAQHSRYALGRRPTLRTQAYVAGISCIVPADSEQSSQAALARLVAYGALDVRPVGASVYA